MKIGNFDLGRCYFEDCLPAMKQLPTKSFDLCVTDPPWKTIKKHDWNFKRGKPVVLKEIDYDIYPTEWHNKWLKEARRIARIVIFCVPLKNVNEWIKMTDPKGVFILAFKNGIRPSKISLVNSYSPYLVLFDDPPEKKPQSNVYEIVIECGFVKQVQYIHPSAKSSSFFKYLIEGFGAKTVLDPFLGSGCIAEASIEAGAEWLGFEIDHKYEPDIEKRIEFGKEKGRKGRSLY